MSFTTKNLRTRFDQMRKAMCWSWKDIDTITGRKSSRTNINKRVPAWSHLAIYVHERYEVLLRHHVVEILSLHLGREWSLTQLSSDVLYFIREGSHSKGVTGMNLRFYTGGFELMSDTSVLYEVAERLKVLYPGIGEIMPHEEGYVVQVPIRFDTGCFCPKRQKHTLSSLEVEIPRLFKGVRNLYEKANYKDG